MENPARTAIIMVIGMDLAKPLSCVTSRVPAPLSSSPTVRNNAALYSACTTRNVATPTVAYLLSPPRNIINAPRAITVV